MLLPHACNCCIEICVYTTSKHVLVFNYVYQYAVDRLVAHYVAHTVTTAPQRHM